MARLGLKYIPELLHELDKLQESHDYYKNKLYEVQQELKDTIEKCDYWKKRAETMERAIKCDKCICPCWTCVHHYKDDCKHYGEEECAELGYADWQFDYERFTKGEEK